MTTYTVILSPEPDGGYAVFCPAMPGAISQGDSRGEALTMIAEAMEGWLAVALAHGEGPLPETPALIAGALATVLDERAELGFDMRIETATVQIERAAAAA